MESDWKGETKGKDSRGGSLLQYPVTRSSLNPPLLIVPIENRFRNQRGVGLCRLWPLSASHCLSLPTGLDSGRIAWKLTSLNLRLPTDDLALSLNNPSLHLASIGPGAKGALDVIREAVALLRDYPILWPIAS